MAERVFLPRDDDSTDLVMRLSSEEASALYSLLSKLTADEMAAKCLDPDQVAAVCRVMHVTY